MKKFIVTTTINKPTKATLKFCEISKNKDWRFVVVGDTKTPHEEYEQLTKQYDIIYLNPDTQTHLYPRLSETIGWKTIQRRNIGFIYAYKEGAELVATIDDDNIPYDTWGDNIIVGSEVDIMIYNHNTLSVFDPLSITKNNHLWHRGYPIEFVPMRGNISFIGTQKRKILIQADLWDGDPDIDAIARLTYKPEVDFDNIIHPYGSNQISPFNSQNTFISREVLPYYCVFPFVGRMDDIWGSYIVQHYFPNCVAYNKASVYQDRNEQNLITNLKNEIFGYENTLKLLNDLPNFKNYLPENTLKFWDEYRKLF